MRSPSRIRPLATLAVLALLAFGLPGAASTAARPPATVAPPGDSGITQYLEVVPSAGGAVPPRSGGGAGPTGTAAVLSTAQRHRLDKLGTDGRTLAGVVEATAPPATPGGAVAAVHTQSSGALEQSATSTAQSAGSSVVGAGSSPASLVLDATGGGSGGLGGLLPAFMLASALAAGAFALRRRRMHQ